MDHQVQSHFTKDAERVGPPQGHGMSLHFQLSLLPLKLPRTLGAGGHREEQQTSLLEVAPPVGSVQRGKGSLLSDFSPG